MSHLNNLHYFSIILHIPSTDLLNLLQVSKKIDSALHNVPRLPYLPPKLLSKLLLYHKVVPRIQVDYQNMITPPINVSISYIHRSQKPQHPPPNNLRQFITALNIPLHQKYVIDLSTFPYLTKLAVTFYSPPPTIPHLNLKMFHIHLPSITVLPHLTSLQYITGPTFVHLRKPNISIINEINSFLPNAQIITEKMENGDVLNKVHLFDTITTICSTKRSCVSLPIQFAFGESEVKKQHFVTSAVVYGRLSPNTDSIFPIEFKHLLLYDLHLPQRCSISIKDCETLSIQRCNKLTGIVGLGKCNLKSLSFSKDPSLSLSRLPTTLTFLDASDWKTLTLPNLHELVELRLKDCPSIKYLNLPTGLKILSVVECSLLRKFINLNELQLLSLKLAKCPLLKYASTPTTLTQLTLEHLDVFSYSFENQTQLINATLIGCGFLTKLNLPPSIRNITISCCSNLIEISNQQCNFDNASITSCSQLSALSISSINLSIEYLPSLQHITTENTKKITAIKSNVIPEINVEEYILKNVILDSIPIATNMYLNGCTIQQQQLSILTQVTSLKLKNMTNLTEITIGNSVKHLSIRKCGIESIVIPNSITHCSLQELHIKKLNIPTSCIELKLMKCPDIETIELPTTLSYLKIKKCKKDLLSNSFLPFIPNEILLDFCKSSN